MSTKSKILLLALAGLLLAGYLLLWPNVSFHRAVACYRGTYQVYRESVRRMDGKVFVAPQVPDGQDYLDTPGYTDYLETYDGEKTWWVVRTHWRCRTYRPGAKDVYGGKEEVFDDGGTVSLWQSEEFLGQAEKIKPGAVAKEQAINRMLKYIEEHGDDQSPELRKLMQDAGTPLPPKPEDQKANP